MLPRNEEKNSRPPSAAMDDSGDRHRQRGEVTGHHSRKNVRLAAGGREGGVVAGHHSRDGNVEGCLPPRGRSRGRPP